MLGLPRFAIQIGRCSLSERFTQYKVPRSKWILQFVHYSQTRVGIQANHNDGDLVAFSKSSNFRTHWSKVANQIGAQSFHAQSKASRTPNPQATFEYWHRAYLFVIAITSEKIQKIGSLVKFSVEDSVSCGWVFGVHRSPLGQARSRIPILWTTNPVSSNMNKSFPTLSGVGAIRSLVATLVIRSHQHVASARKFFDGHVHYVVWYRLRSSTLYEIHANKCLKHGIVIDCRLVCEEPVMTGHVT